jgi:hypothetical protein
LATALRIESCPSETTPIIGPLERRVDLPDELGQVVLAGGQQAAGQKDLATEAIAEDPEDLVADVGLQAVDGQDHTACGRRHSINSNFYI